MSCREDEEIHGGGFGKLPRKKEFSTSELEVIEGSLNFYKDSYYFTSPIEKEDFNGNIETKLTILYDEKLVTESTWKEGLYKFPDDDHMKEFHEDFIELFRKDGPMNDNPSDKPDDMPDDDQDDDDQAGHDDKPDDDQDDNDIYQAVMILILQAKKKRKLIQKQKMFNKNSECVRNPAENISKGIEEEVKKLNGNDWENREYGESFTQWIDDASVNEAFENFDSLLLKSNSLKLYKPIVDENEMPSFSLGLTQKSTFSRPLPVVSFKNLTPLLLSFEDEVLKTADKINDKRSVKPSLHIPSPFVCSPYINKKINAKRFISKSELSVSNSLFAMVRDEMEPVFQSISGSNCYSLDHGKFSTFFMDTW